jgi:hypothetical protein
MVQNVLSDLSSILLKDSPKNISVNNGPITAIITPNDLISGQNNIDE